MAESPSSPAPVAPAAAADVRLRPLGRVVIVTALFLILGGGAMLVRTLRARGDNPLLSPQAAALKERLRTDPKNEPLKQQIRELDLQLRRQFFRNVAFLSTGTWLVVGGALVLLGAARYRRRLVERRPRPGKKPDVASVARLARFGRFAVLGVALAVTGVLAALVLTAGRSPLPAEAAQVDAFLKKLAGEPAAEEVAAPASHEAMRANWPRFLGADANPVTTNFAWPAAIDIATGTGVEWKTAVPAPGFNSPIVWSNRVYFSGGDATNRSVFCFDALSGAPVWQRAVTNVPGGPARQPEIPESTGFAASTMATDGRSVFVIFANGDLAAFTLDGRPVWSKNLGVPKNQYGHASSLAVWDGRVIIQFDQGESGQGLSRLIALDGVSGRVVWQPVRAVPEAWASPAVFESGGRLQIVTLAGQWIIAHSGTDGAELWRVEGLTGEITPSPVFAGGLVYVVSPSDKLMAIRPDGTGDVTKTHVVWKADDGIPDITSPVSDGERVFVVTTSGTLTAYDAKAGKKLWDHELGFDVNATPAIAGGRLLIIGSKGRCLVVEAGAQFKEIAQFDLAETVFASPAFAQGRIYVRGARTLFCLGPAAGP